nr:hypothetical protein [Tanacetum cinerariifolium]
MSTRSSARNLFPPINNPELTIQRRSRTDPTLLNNSEMAAEGTGDLPVPDLRTMEELCQPSLNGQGGPTSLIAIQTNFGLKNDMIQQVQNSCQFYGLPGDDSNKHLDKFLHVTQIIKVNGVTDDALRLYLFPHSLTHHATAWLTSKSKQLLRTVKLMVVLIPLMIVQPPLATLKTYMLQEPIKNQNFHNQNRNQGNHNPHGNNQGRNQFVQGASHGQNPPPAYQALGYQAPVHQPQIPQPQVVTTNEFTNLMKANDAILKNMQTNMTSLTNSNLELKNMFGLFMKMNTVSSSGSGTLSGNTITNPKEDLKGITTQSGTAYQGPTIPTTFSSLPPVVERETEATKDMVHPTNDESTKDPVASPVSASKPNQRPLIPYPSRLHDQKLRDKTNDQREKFFQIFKDLNFNISFAIALILMPKFGLSIKSLLTNKDKLCELAKTSLNEHYSAVLLKKLPEKLGDPDKFLIPCDFPGMAECLALADLGASINLMPLSVWNTLPLPDFSPMCMTLELVDHFDADPRVPLIPERSFLKTGRALIDVFEGELTLRVGKEAITFNLDQTSRYSANYNDMTANRIDVINMACDEYSQEVLGFSDVTAKVDAFLALEDDPTSPEVNQSYVDTEGDILLLEAFLNDDPSLPPQNQGNYLPQRFDESFSEAWDIFKDLLRSCPHHGFSELHQLDTFYNALNFKDQDLLNSAVGGNFLDKMPREWLAIIENMSKVRYLHNKPVGAKVSMNTSTSVEESCVACGGAHSYRNCPATNGTVYRDNIQEFVSQAFTVNYNQGNTSYHPPMMSKQIRPLSFPPVPNNPNVQLNQRNNQNRFNQNQNQGNNFNHGPVYQPLVFEPLAYQDLAYQALAPQTQGVSKEDFLSYVKANDAAMRNMQTQGKNMQNQLTNLTELLTKFVKSNSASTSSSSTVPSNTIAHPRSDLKIITTRSDVSYDGPQILPPPSFLTKVVEKEPEATKDTVNPTNNGSTEDVQPPVFQSESPILTSKSVNSLIIEHVASPVSAPRPNQRPSIPYPSRMQDQKLSDKANDQPLADLGASINLMSLPVWNKLSVPNLFPTCMTLELVDRLISHPVGVAEDVYVKVVELTLRVVKEAITFNLDQTSRYSANYNDMTAKRIDVIDMAYEEYSQEVLSFSNVIASGNPTPYYDPIVSTTSLTLTSFGNSDFLLEEVDAFLALEDDPTSLKVDQSYLDSKGDILLLEAFLNDDPSLPPSNQGNYLPEVCKELKICEAKSDKSSIDEPSEVEIKDLPPHLEYVFLEGDDKLLVITAKDLSVEEKIALITVLMSHKRAIAWKLSDIKEELVHQRLQKTLTHVLELSSCIYLNDRAWGVLNFDSARVRFNFRRTSLTGFPAQSIRSYNAIVLDSPYLLVLITEMSQSRQLVDTSLIHLESRKSSTAELFDVNSGRISIRHCEY